MSFYARGVEPLPRGGSDLEHGALPRRVPGLDHHAGKAVRVEQGAGGGGEQDYALVPLLPRTIQRQWPPTPWPRQLAPNAGCYDFIPLPSP